MQPEDSDCYRRATKAAQEQPSRQCGARIKPGAQASGHQRRLRDLRRVLLRGQKCVIQRLWIVRVKLHIPAGGTHACMHCRTGCLLEHDCERLGVHPQLQVVFHVLVSISDHRPGHDRAGSAFGAFFHLSHTQLRSSTPPALSLPRPPISRAASAWRQNRGRRGRLRPPCHRSLPRSRRPAT